MSEINDLIAAWRQDKDSVIRALTENEALRKRLLELDETLSAGEKVSASGFALWYQEEYGRKLPYVFHDVAEQFAWAFHNRKGVMLEGWRGMGKSTFFLAWCPYIMGVNPLGSTALIRINDRKAKEMGKAISEVIKTNLGWKKVFGHVLPDEQGGWSVENGFEVLDSRVTGPIGSPKFDDGYAKWRMMCLADHLSEKSLVCNGVESGSNIGLHPTNGMWFDDLHDEENTTSSAEMKKVTGNIQGNFVGTWFSAGGSPTLGVFCTPWSKNPPDAYEVMMQSGLFKKVSIPIYTENPHGESIPATTTDGFPIDVEYAGKRVFPTWPEAFGAQKIADIIHAAKSRFGQQYLLNPELSKPKNMRYFEFPARDIRPLDWELILGVDPVATVRGISTGQGISHFAAVEYLKSPYNTLIINDGVIEKWDALEAEEYIANLQRSRRNYKTASIENNGAGAMFISMISRNSGVKYHAHPVSELGSGKKKDRQYRFLQPLFAAGLIMVSDAKTKFLDAVREYLEIFPSFDDDSYLADIGDALAMGVLEVPEIYTKVVTSAASRDDIWSQKKKTADPWNGLLGGYR